MAWLAAALRASTRLPDAVRGPVTVTSVRSLNDRCGSRRWTSIGDHRSSRRRLRWESGTRLAMAGAGMPTPWQMGMQDMVTELGRERLRVPHLARLAHRGDLRLRPRRCIVAIVMRFNEDKNPVPSRTTHNTWLEVAWTIVPVLILSPSRSPPSASCASSSIIPQHDIVVKTTGYAWYWGYEYPSDQGGVQVRFEHGRRRRTSSPASRAFSRSTTRWSFR